MKTNAFTNIFVLMACACCFCMTNCSNIGDNSRKSAGQVAQLMRGFNGYTTLAKSDIQDAYAYGANTIRLMLMITDLYELDSDNEPVSDTIDPQKLAYILRVASWTQELGMLLVIDVHETPGLVRWSGWKDFTFWDVSAGQDYRNFLVHTWRQLADAFSAFPEDVILYEMLNEPEPKENDSGAPEETGYIWDDLQVRILRAIRRYDKKHIVICAPPYAWRVNSLDQWDPPDELLMDGRVIANIHMYHPHDFTMQEEYENLGYPGRFNGDIFEYEYWDRDRIIESLLPVSRFQRKYPSLPLIVTEMSVQRKAPGAAQWLADTIDAFYSLNMGWTYHCFREKKYNGSSMWDLEKGSTDRMRIVQDGFLR